MSKIELAAQYVIDKCNDPSCGYDQDHRWLPNVDCSSLMCLAWQRAGVPVIDYGCSYTGNMLRFLELGFIDVVGRVNLANGYGLQRGDVLLNTSIGHTAMFLGDNLIGQASCNEFGGIVGGISGDQGAEVSISGYANFYAGWEHVLRYVGESEEASKQPIGIGKVINVGDDVLNVRTGPGVTYPLASWPQLGLGNLFEVCDEQNGWFYIRIANTHYGWVKSAFVEYTPFNKKTAKVGFVHGVAPYTLNVRTGPGISYPILASWRALAEDNAVEILEEINGWYKVKIANKYIGYVSCQYIRS